MSGIKVLAEAKTPGLVGWVTKFLSTDAAKKFVPEPEVLAWTWKENTGKVLCKIAADLEQRKEMYSSMSIIAHSRIKRSSLTEFGFKAAILPGN
ncbi:hypothetical protein ACET3Z_020882 [Daucus carota]